jgi:hypothetical protein
MRRASTWLSRSQKIAYSAPFHTTAASLAYDGAIATGGPVTKPEVVTTAACSDSGGSQKPAQAPSGSSMLQTTRKREPSVAMIGRDCGRGPEEISIALESIIEPSALKRAPRIWCDSDSHATRCVVPVVPIAIHESRGAVASSSGGEARSASRLTTTSA